MNVYSYFHPVNGLDAREEGELIGLWSRSWRRQGWNPILLSFHQHAATHPQYRAFSDLIRTFPTINNPEYERACWLRWLALAKVGGGLMTDYDVINRNYTADEHENWLTNAIYDKGAVPCAVRLGRPDEVINAMLQGPHKHDGKHYSDMLWFQNNTPALLSKVEGIGIAYTDFDWEQAGFVHFSHHSCASHKHKKRSEIIKKVMHV